MEPIRFTEATKIIVFIRDSRIRSSVRGTADRKALLLIFRYLTAAKESLSGAKAIIAEIGYYGIILHPGMNNPVFERIRRKT